MWKWGFGFGLGSYKSAPGSSIYHYSQLLSQIFAVMFHKNCDSVKINGYDFVDIQTYLKVLLMKYTIINGQ